MVLAELIGLPRESAPSTCHAGAEGLRAHSDQGGAGMSETPGERPTVVLVGTLDTKGHEYAFLRDRIRARNVDVLLVDAGILGEPLTESDVSRQEVAAAAGADVQALADAGDRSAAIEVMGRGATEIVLRLHAEGRLDAIGALGGTGGTTIATHAMRALPVGVPKLMVSTVASGDTSPYVGTMDVTMMHSVVDVAGINRISARIMANAARALAGMASESELPSDDEKPLVVASMWGITTPCVTTARERLEELGYDVLVFHQTGTGGRSMEEMIATGLVVGVLDITTAELTQELAGGIFAAGPERLEGAGRLGIPQVVSLGGVEVVNIDPRSDPERFDGRPIYFHNEDLATTRTEPGECRELAAVIARKLNAATGPTVLFVPLRGLSLLSTEGQTLCDPVAEEALFSELRKLLDRSKVEVHEIDAAINDRAFALAMAERLHELVTGMAR
jgi:uncharacterized protein (UPF0261 family)